MAILIAASIFALICVILELLIVSKIRPLRGAMSKWPLAGIAFSIMLSVFLGGLFGAAGVMLLMAGVISTVITGGIYKLWGKMDTAATTTKNSLSSWIADFKATWGWVGTVIKYGLIVLTSPIWVPVWLHRKWNTQGVSA